MKIDRASSRAFSLVEVALALGVAAFALVAIFGLLPVGINTNTTSIQQTVATNLAADVMSDMREAPTAAAIAAHGLTAKSPRYGIDVSGSGGNTTLYLDGSGTAVASALAASYKVTFNLTPPGTGTRTATFGTMVISWPAGANPPAGSITSFVALDRN